MKTLRSLLAFGLAVSILAGAIAMQTPHADQGAEILPALKADGPRWYKGNLHTHSFWSDGDDFPEMIADWYRRHGYHFLTLSDHNVLSEGQKWVDIRTRETAFKKYATRFGNGWVEQKHEGGKDLVRVKPLSEFRSMLEEPGRFLLVQGEELTTRYVNFPVHMNGINLRDVIKPIAGDSVAETLRINLRAVEVAAQRSGIPNLAFVNHPNYGSGVDAQDMILAEELRFFEVYNGHPGVNNYGDEKRPSCEQMWDAVLAHRLGKSRLPVVYGVGTDDAHNYHTNDQKKPTPGRGWVVVRAPYLSAEAIVKAMTAGDFYASTGVVLQDIQHVGKTLRLKIQAEKDVRYQTQFIASIRDGQVGKVVAQSEDLEPSYTCTGQELYVRARVICTKEHPNPFRKGDLETAWTQPMRP